MKPVHNTYKQEEKTTTRKENVRDPSVRYCVMPGKMKMTSYANAMLYYPYTTSIVSMCTYIEIHSVHP